MRKLKLEVSPSTIPLPGSENLEKAMLSTLTNLLLARSSHGTKPYVEEVSSRTVNDTRERNR